MSDRRGAEQTFLREDEAWTFLDHTQDLVTVVNAQGRLLYVNESSRVYFGLEPAAAVGEFAFDFVHPDDRERTLQAFAAWVRDKVEFVAFENRQVAVDGAVRDTRWTIMPRYQDGQLESIWSIARDVTDRKRYEEALARSRQALQIVMDCMDALVYVADFSTYELLFLSQFGRDLFGEFSPGQKCYEVLQVGQTGPCSFCTNGRLVDAAGRPTGVYRWEFQNTKTQVWFDCRDEAIRWSDGRLVASGGECLPPCGGATCPPWPV